MAPEGVVLTVIFEVDPQLDTLTVFDIIRAPGTLRRDYPAAAEAGPGELLFSFLNANERVLRQTAMPYPGPNHYEVPSEEGTITEEVLPEEARTLLLKTQASSRIRWLEVKGQSSEGKVIQQRIDLRAKK